MFTPNVGVRAAILTQPIADDEASLPTTNHPQIYRD